MQVNVKLYGPFRMMSGRGEIAVKADDDAICVKDFLSLLARKIPQFSRTLSSTNAEQFLKERILLLTNDMPCNDELKLIHDGDQIKILTIVSGG